MPDDTEFYEILGRFAVARSLLTVCHRSLKSNESTDGPADEAEVLVFAIEKLRRVYDELDSFDINARRRLAGDSRPAEGRRPSFKVMLRERRR